MNKPMKAAVLSAFIFPGVGQFFLKKYASASVIAGTAFVTLAYLATKTLQRALEVTEKIQSGEIPLDVATINEIVSNQTSGIESQLLNAAGVVFLFTWLIGIVDAYRVGRIHERNINEVD